MLFNEKIYKLRKENGLSQEALAEKLNTSRQAISKWENNQGYPETEKLLLISNLFNVSVDYLLKDTNENIDFNDKCYYASKEMIEEYFLNRKSAFTTITTGIFIFILGIGAYFKFKYENLSIIIASILLVLGGIIITKGSFKLDDKFNILQKEVLIFDKNYKLELQKNYKNEIAKLSSIFTISFAIFLISIFPIVKQIEPFTKDFTNGIPIVIKIMFILIAISCPIMCYSGNMYEIYLSILDNEKYSNTFSFRLLKKIRIKLDTWLK